MESYRSGRTLARIVIGLAAVRILHQAAMATSAAFLALNPKDPTATAMTKAMSSGIFHLVVLASIVVFLMWVHRSISNLQALGSTDVTAPSDAVWAFIIPFVNLVRPHTIMSKLWTESQRQGVDENGVPLPVSTRIVTVWWVLNLVAGLVALYMVVLGVALKMGTPTLDAVKTLFQTIAVASAVGTVDGVLFVLMTKRIQDRQDAQHADLELRAAAPQPDASSLR